MAASGNSDSLLASAMDDVSPSEPELEETTSPNLMTTEEGLTTEGPRTPGTKPNPVPQQSLEEEYRILVSSHAQYDSERFACELPNFLALTTVSCPSHEQDGPGVDIVCVLDKSGSMQGPKMSLVRKSMRRLVRNLRDKDRIAFITFDTQVSLMLPFTRMNQEGKRIAKDAIKGLLTGSSTNLCEGLLRGIELLKSDPAGNDVQAILLFTDGQANIGVRSPIGILQEVKRAAGTNLMQDVAQWSVDDVCQWLSRLNLQMYSENFKNMGVDGEVLKYLTSEMLTDDLNVRRMHLNKFQKHIEALRGEQIEGEGETSCATVAKPRPQRFQLHTFGFGLDHNTGLLESLANEFDGMYYFMENEESIIDGFAACLGGLLSVAAQNIEVVFQPAEGVTDFKVKKQEGLTVDPNGSATFRCADIYADETVEIVVSGSLPAIEAADPNYVMFTAHIKYRNAIMDRDEEQDVVGIVNRSGQQGEMNVQVDGANNQAVSAEAMAEAAKLADLNRLEEARKVISRTKTYVASSKSYDTHRFSQNVLSDFDTCLDGLRDVRSYRSLGHRTMAQNRKTMAHGRAVSQRSTTFKSQSTRATQYQKAMTVEFERRDDDDSPSPERYERINTYSAPSRAQRRNRNRSRTNFPNFPPPRRNPNKRRSTAARAPPTRST